MSVDRAAVKKSAEDAGEFWEPQFGDEIPLPSTILALLAELEQAENARHCKFMVEGGPVVMATEYDEVKAKLKASEAALRTLRQAAEKAVAVWGVSGSGFFEECQTCGGDRGTVTNPREEVLHSPDCQVSALAAALAAEGGK